MTRSKSTPGTSMTTPVDEGTTGANLPNPKSTAPRRNLIPAPTDSLAQNGKFGTTSHYEGQTSRNQADKSGTVPDPSILNRGYEPTSGGAGPATDISANRIFGIPDPTVVLGGDAEDDDGPVKPSFGVGTTGE